MIEARVDTILSGVELVGTALPPEELERRRERVRAARRAETARYCENPDCRVLKLTGERQRLRGLNGVIVEKGAYRGVQYARVCSWCESEEVASEAIEEEALKEATQLQEDEKCWRGHKIAEVGRYSCGTCKRCKQEANARRREGLRIGRESHRHGYVVLYGLDDAKKQAGMSWPALAREIGVKTNTCKSWAYLTCAAPLDAAETLARVLGVTVADLTGEAP